jgi:hypothetical protein
MFDHDDHTWEHDDLLYTANYTNVNENLGRGEIGIPGHLLAATIDFKNRHVEC